MAPWGIILIAAAAAVFLFVIVPALLIFIAVFYHKKAIPFEQYDLKKYQNHYYIPFLSRIAAARKWIQSKPHTRVWQSSYDGLQLLGDYYDRGAARTAILFHGIGAEMYTNVSAHARFLYQCGFNVLITCQRAHGESGGRWTTIGLREQHDVLSWTRRAEELGAEEILLYGVSMGAASVAYASDKLRGTRVKAAVIDSGFYSIYEQMRRDAHKNHIPKIMLPAQQVLARLFLRVNLKQPTADTLARAAVPVFFLHGTGDETVECRWGKTNFEACASPKELLLVEGAPHTLSILHNPELAGKRLQGFFGKYFT